MFKTIWQKKVSYVFSDQTFWYTDEFVNSAISRQNSAQIIKLSTFLQVSIDERINFIIKKAQQWILIARKRHNIQDSGTEKYQSRYFVYVYIYLQLYKQHISFIQSLWKWPWGWKFVIKNIIQLGFIFVCKHSHKMAIKTWQRAGNNNQIKTLFKTLILLAWILLSFPPFSLSPLSLCLI